MTSYTSARGSHSRNTHFCYCDVANKHSGLQLDFLIVLVSQVMA